jgi:TonB family protein
MMISLMMAAALVALDIAPKPGSRARANLAQYFTADDYPPSALMAHAEGAVSFRLLIAADGRVTKCTVTRSAGDPALDAATCAILRERARYQPARDATGRAIAGSDHGRVVWRLPTDAPEPFYNLRAPARLELTVGVAADGRPICAAMLNGGSGGADGEALCGTVTGPAADRFLRDFPRDSAITMTVAIGLDGEPLPAGSNAHHGALFMDSVARLTVAADGRVTDCRVTETNVHGELGPLPTPNLCAFPSFGTRLFPARDGAAPRGGTIRVEIHVRSGAGRRAT